MKYVIFEMENGDVIVRWETNDTRVEYINTDGEVVWNFPTTADWPFMHTNKAGSLSVILERTNAINFSGLTFLFAFSISIILSPIKSKSSPESKASLMGMVSIFSLMALPYLVIFSCLTLWSMT